MNCRGEEVGGGGDKVQGIRKVGQKSMEERGWKGEKRRERKERGRRDGSKDREKDGRESKRGRR